MSKKKPIEIPRDKLKPFFGKPVIVRFGEEDDSVKRMGLLSDIIINDDGTFLILLWNIIFSPYREYGYKSYGARLYDERTYGQARFYKTNANGYAKYETAYVKAEAIKERYLKQVYKDFLL